MRTSGTLCVLSFIGLVACGGSQPPSSTPPAPSADSTSATPPASSATPASSTASTPATPSTDTPPATPTTTAQTGKTLGDAPRGGQHKTPTDLPTGQGFHDATKRTLATNLTKTSKGFPKQTVGYKDCWATLSISGQYDKDFDLLVKSCGDNTGMLAYVEPAVAELGPKDKRDTFTVKMLGGMCYRIFAVGEASLGDTDIRVQKTGGALVAVDETTHPISIIESDKPWCMDEDQSLNFILEVDGPGQGKYKFGIFAKPK